MGVTESNQEGSSPNSFPPVPEVHYMYFGNILWLCYISINMVFLLFIVFFNASARYSYSGLFLFLCCLSDHRHWSKTNTDSTCRPACGNRFTFLLRLFCSRGGCFKQRFNLPELWINTLTESPAQVRQRSGRLPPYSYSHWRAWPLNVTGAEKRESRERPMQALRAMTVANCTSAYIWWTKSRFKPPH